MIFNFAHKKLIESNNLQGIEDTLKHNPELLNYLLKYAVDNGNRRDIVKLLIDKGADMHCHIGEFYSILNYSKMLSETSMCKVEHKKTYTCLLSIARKYKIEMLNGCD